MNVEKQRLDKILNSDAIRTYDNCIWCRYWKRI